MMRKKRRNVYTTAHFLAVCEAVTDASFKSIKELDRPTCYKSVMFKKDLSGLSYGELLELFKLTTFEDWLLKPLQIIEGFTEHEVLSADITITAGYMNWAIKQIEHIGKLFEQLNTGIDYTPEEISAGVHNLNFGEFGIIDSYAQRMHITNHDDVLRIPWGMIYQTMKIDHETVAYQRRLQKLIHNKK